MTEYIAFWFDLMKQSDSLLAIPLLACGVGLLLAGWRLWRVAMILSFLTMGGVAGGLLAPHVGIPALGALASAVLLAAISFLPVRSATALLGGILGTAVLAYILHAASVPNPVLAVIAGISLLGLTALAAVYTRNVMILVTAFEGATLVVSALFVLGGHGGSLLRQASLMIEDNSLMLPFALIVPTVVGCALQFADVNQKQSGMARI